MGAFVHDPDAVLDYGWDWSAWLATDETITTSSWTITPAGPTLKATAAGSANSDGTHDDTTTTVWVDGGSAGAAYTLTNHVTTSAGREDDRTHTLRCANR